MGVSNGQVRADLDLMSGTASKLSEHYEMLEASITTLRNQSALHSEDWSGVAKNAYVVAMSDVDAAWNRLNGVLHEISSNIRTSGARYDDTDAANATQFRTVEAGSITSTLNP